MKKEIEERSYRLRYDLDNIFDKESRSRAANLINLILPKTPIGNLKRFGNYHDGGYVLFDDISFEDYLISFGVANDISFEYELSNLVCGIDMYDHSIDKLPYDVLKTNFYKQKIGGSKEQGLIDIKQSLDNVNNKKDYLLKIDIEGYEWELLNNASPQDLLSFRQIVVEFHWIDKILDNNYYRIILNALKKISSTHQVVNVHANNYGDIVQFSDLFIPEALEITFLRKGSYSFIPYDESKYVELNKPCNPDLIDVYFVYKDEVK